MVPPVPIPNTVVKHLEAESTCLETGWEDRKLPVGWSTCLGRCFFVVYLLSSKVKISQVLGSRSEDDGLTPYLFFG